MPIGPQTVSSPAGKRKRSHEDDGSGSDESIGPQPPATTNKVENSGTKKARVIGPSLPPSLQHNKIATTASGKDEDSDSSDDDDFGPSLPTKEDLQDVKKNSTTASISALAQPPAKPLVQRDEWMTMEPATGDWSQRVDPTKIKSRKFNTSRSVTTAKTGGDSWHETPEQKQARLQREMLGIKGDRTSRSKPASAEPEQDLETAQRMKEYSKARGPSLYDAHRQKHKAEEDDDPSARAFDREKDIAGGLQINATQRRDMMKKSSDFNSRFSGAKYL